MSTVQAPEYTTDYPRACIDAGPIKAEPDVLYSRDCLEENAGTRKSVEIFSQYKLQTYQATAVVVRTTALIPFLPVILALTDVFLSLSPHSPLSLPE